MVWELDGVNDRLDAARGRLVRDEDLVLGLLAVGAAIASVMVMPIKAEWARWAFNMIVPFPAILVAIGAVVASF